MKLSELRESFRLSKEFIKAGRQYHKGNITAEQYFETFNEIFDKSTKTANVASLTALAAAFATQHYVGANNVVKEIISVPPKNDGKRASSSIQPPQ